MLKLDHLTVIAPTLTEGVSHVQNCLDLDVPFGTRHDYMGTHNHRLQLGNSVYLEIVALDPEGTERVGPAGSASTIRRRSDRTGMKVVACADGLPARKASTPFF